MTALAICLAGLGASAPRLAQAQEFVGFERGSFGRVVLSRKQAAGTGDIELELSVGQYNNESIQNYSPQSVFARMGHAVGRLDILTDAGIFPCTAFIVSDKHILTNYHCVPGILDNAQAEATRIDAVQFVAGYTQQGVEDGTRTFIVSPTPIEAHKDLDYAVLEVLGDPSAEYGMLALSNQTPQDGDPYWVIGHPMGEAQRISREQCRANRPALSGHQLLHTCDTLPGNSGSPVIDASLQMVVGLHHAGSKRDSVNFAIPMRDILARSSVLEAALKPGLGGPVTDAAPVPPAAGGDQPLPGGDELAGNAAMCDGMYKEAKELGQCYAYDAYLTQCQGHPYAVFAQGYVNSQCGGDDMAAAPIAPSPPQPPAVTPTPTLLRPWCGGTLNATEAAICADPYLAGLDAEMSSAYNGQSHVSASDQKSWLSGTRNACGGNASCIGRVVVDRIAWLKTPPAPSRPEAGTGGPQIVRGNYTLGSSSCYIVTASRTSIAEAQGFVQQWFPGRSGVRIFQSDNGYYGVVVETLSRSRSDARLSQLKSQGAIPGDSYCSSGNRFVAEVIYGSSGGGGGGAPSTTTMYVDNNSDGSLNVRSGPSTNYGIITEVPSGSTVQVFARQGKWSNVILPDGRRGWVYSPLLTSNKPSVQRVCWGNVINLGPISTYNTATGAGFLAVRDQPNARSGRKISELYLGDRVKVLAQSGTWAKVQCVSGNCMSPYAGRGGATGWSSKKYLSINCN
ncbi:SH3 domain-containing protein [Tropicibacter oceani]|uniref:Serine protease n=1 Tax=Tropicibacter oceani TaxID=3058420 RepID=A0ABY8QN49_9RHOB|nr:SH3 domain-containing protein [Tropicibacter oceani]WGW05537.1 SH3 domain-containing protein [Tropicibacter oceani]